MAARGGGGCSHPGCGQQVGVSEAAGAGLMRCTKCRQKVYCSKACQVAGWKGGHKQECERLRSEGAEAGGGGSGGAAAQEASAVMDHDIAQLSGQAMRCVCCFPRPVIWIATGFVSSAKFFVKIVSSD